MSYEEVTKVWMSGKLVDFADAKIHAFSHVFHYGSGIFEGARVYKTRQGAAAFRIDEHINRIYDSCKVYRMEIPYSREEFKDAIWETIRANGFDACYIRPVVYRGLGAVPQPEVHLAEGGRGGGAGRRLVASGRASQQDGARGGRYQT